MNRGKIESNIKFFKKVVRTSKSIAEVLRKMKLNPFGRNYTHVRFKIKKYNLDISHFNKLTENKPKIFIDEKLVKKEIKNCYSLRGLANKIGVLNYDNNTTNYRYLKKIIKKYNLDTSHFSGQLWSEGKSRFDDARLKRISDNRSLSIWNKTFCKNSCCHINNKKLIEMLINRKIKKYKCDKCGLFQWEKKMIRLQLDHINGDNCDNRIKNLRLLCPNCHSQTETYCGKNIDRVKNNHDDLKFWCDNMLKLSNY